MEDSYIAVFKQILDIISYEGDKDKHAKELKVILDDSMKQGAALAAKKFFEDYFKILKPTLSEEQTQKLRDYFAELQGPVASTENTQQ